MGSPSDYKTEICGVKFTLRATIETFAEIERRCNMPAALVFQRMEGVPRLTDVSECFAAMALPHGKHTAQAIRAIIPLKYGPTLREMCVALNEALKLAAPEEDPAAQSAEGGGEAVADPT